MIISSQKTIPLVHIIDERNVKRKDSVT